jgi:thioredoxin-dependent peroxiredoxin
MLEIGTTAPGFTLPDQGGTPTTLSQELGRWVLVWWYPKADTPGCTLEGQGLRDQAGAFDQAGCVVLGVSYDPPEENRAFRDRHGFPFRLLSDADRQVTTRYEATRQPDERHADYPQRISYLIDPEGTIRRAYAVTDPAGHAGEVLADLAAEKR